MQLLFRASGAVQIIIGIIKSLGVGCCWEEALTCTVQSELKVNMKEIFHRAFLLL